MRVWLRPDTALGEGGPGSGEARRHFPSTGPGRLAKVDGDCRRQFCGPDCPRRIPKTSLVARLSILVCHLICHRHGISPLHSATPSVVANILNRIKTPQAQKERGWLCLESFGRVAGAGVVTGKQGAGLMEHRSTGPHSPGSFREFLALVY